jgi:2-oxoisovalerate dehydrogenase E1 component
MNGFVQCTETWEFLRLEIFLWKSSFLSFKGKPNGFTKGRDRSFHFGSKEHNIFGMISHLGAQLGVADGLAFARKLNHEKKCVLVFTGDGGASQGDFHEALNVASVWKLPVLFVLENNQWGYQLHPMNNSTLTLLR